MQVLITMILRLVRNITKQHPKVYKPVKHVQKLVLIQLEYKMKIMDAVSNIWNSTNLQVYCNKVYSRFKKTLQFNIYSKNDLKSQ